MVRGQGKTSPARLHRGAQVKLLLSNVSLACEQGENLPCSIHKNSPQILVNLKQEWYNSRC